MARGTPKMGLTSWSDLEDPYNYQQLDNNWQIIDFHDHTPGRGVQIPAGGIAPGSVGLTQLAPGLPLVPVGGILPFAGSTAPTGFLICDGSNQLQTTYANLYALIGNTYQQSTPPTGYFQLPNLKQRFPLGVAVSGTGSVLGQEGGSIDHTHSIAAQNITVTLTGQSIPVTSTVNIPALSVGAISVGNHLHNLSDAGGAELYTAAVSNAVWQAHTAGQGPDFVAGGYSFIRGASGITGNVGVDGEDWPSVGLIGTTDYGGGFTIPSGSVTTQAQAISASGTGTLSGGTFNGSTVSGTTGSNNAPYLAVNYIIKY